MNELAFEFDWDSMDGSRGAEIRSTWARFALFVDGVPLTEAHDLRTKSVREHIFIPLYPMAEWVSKHWWWLLYEAEGPARRDYERRHNLRHAREGFAFPNVSIRPTGERVTIEWWPISMPAEGVNFASKGSAVLPMEQVRETLSNFITVVLERLELQGVSDTHLHDEWDAVVSTDDEEAAFCISAARAGADPYDLSDSLTDAILNANERLPEHWQEEFFAAADSEQLHAQMTAVLGWRDVLKQNGVDLSALTSLRMQSEKIDPRRAPWEQGYAFAHQLRSTIGIDLKPLRTDEALADALGIPELAIHRCEPGTVKSIDAVVDVVDGEVPAFLATKYRPEQVRFAFTRALFEYLTSTVEPTALLTSARTERQKRNRAFAAEFLAPEAFLRERLPGEYVGLEEIEEVADQLGVSTLVVQHQIQNHGVATVMEY